MLSHLSEVAENVTTIVEEVEGTTESAIDFLEKDDAIVRTLLCAAAASIVILGAFGAYSYFKAKKASKPEVVTEAESEKS